MKFQKSSGTQGPWVDKSSLKNGQRAKIVSEAEKKPSNFADANGNPQMQNVAKVRFEGQPEAVNVSFNQTTVNGLIDAFGDDSVKWQGNYLTVDVEEGRTAGKKSYTLYLIPTGYKKIDDENGFAKIVKEGEVMARQEEQGMPQADDEVPPPDDLPF